MQKNESVIKIGQVTATCFFQLESIGTCDVGAIELRCHKLSARINTENEDHQKFDVMFFYVSMAVRVIEFLILLIF